jgi:transketolase
MPDPRSITDVRAMAARMRRNILAMTFGTGPNGAHVAPALSIVEICAVLYGAVMQLDSRNPLWPDRDRFLLSKGHGALALYAALAEAGFLTPDELRTFEAPESLLSGQPTMCVEKGIEISSGSLGLGLSVGIGIALAGRKAGRRYRTFVLMGDGECNEGTVWEAAMAAAHFELGSLIVIIDANGLQSDGACDGIMNMGSHETKWSSFGWEARNVDGHDLGALVDSFVAPRDDHDRPLVIVASTVKGKGVSFMENNNLWHNNRLTQAQYDQALQELNASEELVAGWS